MPIRREDQKPSGQYFLPFCFDRTWFEISCLLLQNTEFRKKNVDLLKSLGESNQEDKEVSVGNRSTNTPAWPVDRAYQGT